MEFKRYAVYYTPVAGSDLAQFGAAWLGWDCTSGVTVPHPEGTSLDVAAITATPRKYGFHGTIKPPFRLVEGQTLQALQESCGILCHSVSPVRLSGLRLARLGRFLALVPDGDPGALPGLAARAVQELDGFRAPLTEEELAKRRGAGLRPAQDAMLLRWGYPYVMDQFRFHMTLTGRLAAVELATTEPVLSRMVAVLPLHPYVIDALTLVGEDETGRFHTIMRYMLDG